jgi:hypothetical protein
LGDLSAEVEPGMTLTHMTMGQRLPFTSSPMGAGVKKRSTNNQLNLPSLDQVTGLGKGVGPCTETGALVRAKQLDAIVHLGSGRACKASWGPWVAGPGGV